MRIVVIAQDEPFDIPRNVALLCDAPDLEVVGIIALEAGAVGNMRGRLIRWFGLPAVIRVGIAAAARVAGATAGRVLGRSNRVPGGLRDAAHRSDVPYLVSADVNNADTVQWLRQCGPDLIVSFSAPQVFRAEVLSIPEHGCLNLHCSLLPRYRGLLPSFWVLYHGEPVSGATVHVMDSAIDNGGIVMQREVDISGMRTMREVQSATKRVGGELMLDAVRSAAAGTITQHPNPADEGSYFGWPTDEQAREFRAKGYRLI